MEQTQAWVVVFGQRTEAQVVDEFELGGYTKTNVRDFVAHSVDRAVRAAASDEQQALLEALTPHFRWLFETLLSATVTVRPLTSREGWCSEVETSPNGDEIVWLRSGLAGVALAIDKGTWQPYGYVVLDSDGCPVGGRHWDMDDAADTAERLAKEVQS